MLNSFITWLITLLCVSSFTQVVDIHPWGRDPIVPWEPPCYYHAQINPNYCG